MRDDFCALILTHGRPDRVFTYDTLRKAGYTGKVYFVVDDEDKTLPQYVERYGADNVLVFSKREIVKTFDEGDNFNDRRAIIYARNASFDLARQVGCKYFIQLDDDYVGFYHCFNERREWEKRRINRMDAVLTALLDYMLSTPMLAIAMAQGGDHIGGGRGTYAKTMGAKRKAMNSFICAVDRPFQFVGRVNEDVNTYVLGSRRGEIFLTILSLMLSQQQTQANAGGMTEMYLDSGTYVKSFYSVMYAPSCVKIADMGANHSRIHHKIKWNHAAAKIVHERYRKIARAA